MVRTSKQSVPSEKRKTSGCVKIFSEGKSRPYEGAYHQRKNVVKRGHGIGIMQQLEKPLANHHSDTLRTLVLP